MPGRGVYDRGEIAAILDEALICHVGTIDEGSPVVIPTIHARVGDTLYLHGSPGSRMLRSMRAGETVCVTVTLVDGLVVARAAFHNSMNYRSVVVFGEPRIVTDPEEKRIAMRAVVEHVLPGRWDESRAMTDKEFETTLIAAVPLDEASAKVRVGPPLDEEEDYATAHWAGVIPLSIALGEPVPDPRLADGIPVPPSVSGYERPTQAS
jgi:uncharacterized protein